MIRRVRTRQQLLQQLARQLPAERGPHGEPSREEFLAGDYLLIVDRFATLWDVLPRPIPGRDDYRELVLRTRLVPYVSVRGQLNPGGWIDLTDIDIDLDPTGGVIPHPDEDEDGDT